MTNLFLNKRKKLLAAFLSLIILTSTLFSNLPLTVEAAQNQIAANGLYEGLNYYRNTIQNNEMNEVNTYVLEVDPSKLAIATGVPDDTVPLVAGKTQTTKDQAVAARSHGKNVLAAVNADFFHINEDTKIQPQGVTIRDGELLTPYRVGTIFFGILNDGSSVIGDEVVFNEIKDQLVQAVGADVGYLIKDGMIDSSINTGVEPDVLHPRTAVGIKEDGSVVFVVADGRSTISAGLTLGSLADYMLTLGVVTAVNLDGGGSTTLDMLDSDTGEMVTENMPSGGSERPVGNTLLIIDPNTSPNTVNLPQDIDGYYQIQTARDLNKINFDPSANYRLANDIDLTGVTLGKISVFNGNFDGNGKTLANFSSDSALFETLSAGASISNLRLTDVEITGAVNTAPLVGISYGTISGITVTGIISGTEIVGGIVGTLAGSGSITNSSVGAVLTGTTYTGTSNLDAVGGIVGRIYNTPSTIENVYANVHINAVYRAGGIVGYGGGTNAASHIYNAIVEGRIHNTGLTSGGIGGLMQVGLENSIVRDMTITSTITSTVAGNKSGLLAGYNSGNATPHKNNVILSGSITTSSPNTGYRVGPFVTRTSYNYAHPDVTINGSIVTTGLGHNTVQGENATVEQLESQAFYEGLGFDFDTIFEWDAVNKTPTLRNVDMTVDRAPYLSENTINLYTGDVSNISAGATPVSVMSSNDAVASIDASGNVTAISSGKAIVTLIDSENNKVMRRIIVQDPQLTAYPISVSKLDNGKLLASANVANSAPTAYTPTVVFSVYDNAGQMIETQTVENIQIDLNSDKLYQVELDDNEYASYIKMNVFPSDTYAVTLTKEMTYSIEIGKDFVTAIPNSTDHNALFTFNDFDTVITFRTYAKPVSDFGQQTWRFGYSNAIDSKGVYGVPLELGSDFEILSANIADGGTTPDGSIAGVIEPLTFGGQTAKSVAAGEQFWSDEVDYNLTEDHYMAFTWVLRVKQDGGSIPYSLSSFSRMPSYMYYGDHGTQTASTGFGNQSTVTLAPDVFAVKKTVNKRMTFLGDSITHGATASLGQDAFWVANIARAFAQDGIAVRNDGSGGGVAYHAAEDGYWLSKVKDADEVSIMLGVNDINRDRTENEVLADLREIIASIRTANPNVVVTLFTVPPFHVDTAARQKTWLEVNAYIKDRGTTDVEGDGLGADYVFDVAPVWSDGTSPWIMKTEYKAGTSNYHPNDVGSAALSDAYLAWYPTRDNLEDNEITLEQDLDGYYLIKSAEDFAEVNDHPTFNYRLVNDIDLEGISISSITYFIGDFDGNGKTISNMNIGSPLFSTLSETGKIHDLRMDNATVIAGNNAAVVVGNNYGSVENVAVHNAVVEGGANTGGIVGHFVSGSIKNSSVGGKITGTSPVGGIAGGTALAGTTGPTMSTIEGCYANVDITATGRAGGIIGYASANTSNHIYNCIVDGIIVQYGSSSGGIGGLLQIGAENNIIRNMVIITDNSTVEAGKGNVSGLLGGWVNGGQPYTNNVILDGAMTITAPGKANRIGYHANNKSNNYVNADVTINGSPVTTGIGHNTTEGENADRAELRTQAFFEGLDYDFDNTFDWDSVNETPVLRNVDMSVQMPDPRITLTQLIGTAESKVEADYKEDSWGLFKTALSDAVLLIEDSLATNQQIIMASNALETSMEQLIPNVASIEHVLLFVGSDETSRNVVWYSTSTDTGKVQVALKSAMTDDVFPTTYQEFASTIESTQVTNYNSNKAVVTGLTANTEYVYRVGSDEGWSAVYSFKSENFDAEFSFLFAGDPQIGSSGNLGNDELGWETTLNKATEWFPNISFLVSAGDQVEREYNEDHYESFINPEVLRSLPLATTIGNHDTLTSNYKEHFFVPNESADLGVTPAGGNYWYSYNDVLFMVINTNNLSTAEHEQFLTDTMAKYKEQNNGEDPLWKIVTLHHSIYSAAGHAVNVDIIQRRNELSPIFNNLGIDAVLMGHDHVYVRSYMMDGMNPITDGYTAANGDNYASYTKNEDSDVVFYLTANSTSGSKYYSILVNEAFPYVAVMNQENTANIAKIDVTSSSLTFTTYRTGVNNTVNDVLDTFTLKRPTVDTGVTDVTVSSSTAIVHKGSTQSFSAMVNGVNDPEQTVTWSVYGASNNGTVISDLGVLTVAADEMANILTVKATSTVDPTKFGTATVTVETETTNETDVTSVTVSPSTAIVHMGHTQPFSATVNGVNDPEQTVTWSVYGVSNSGTLISDLGVLTVATDEMANILTVKATSTVDPTKFGTATVTVETETINETDVTVTFMNSGSVYDTKTVNSGDTIGSAAWPTDPAKSSYSFRGWFTSKNGAGTRFTSETPVTVTQSVYAYWLYRGIGEGDAGGGSGGEESAPLTPTYLDVITENGVELKLPTTVDEANRSISIDASSYQFKSGSAGITLPANPEVDTYSVGILVSELSLPDGQATLTVNSEDVIITIPSNMLTGVSNVSGNKAEVSFGYGDKSTLMEDVKGAIGDRPLIQLTLSIDGKQIEWSNPDAFVKVSIPYIPTAEELDNPESIVVWYIDDNGNVDIISNGHYNAATGTVTFSTTHFSDYAVAYSKVDFNDVVAGTWYYDAVNFIAAREITTGTGDGKYSPETKLTRGQFIVLIMRAFGIAPDANPTNNFSDAGDTYYTGYLAAAKRLGISLGVSNSLYAPNREITRQEMFTLLYNTLNVIGQLPEGDTEKKLSDFSDSSKIDPWAKDAMTLLIKTGIVTGSEGKLDPADSTTRAEMAQVLYNLLQK